MGYNLNGELGNGTTSNVFLPQQIVASNVTAISAGGGYSLFLKTDGSLWAMGQNSSGQLGDGSNVSTNRPKQIVSGGVIGFAAGVSQSIFLKADGSLWGMGDNSFGELGAGSLVKTNRPIQILGAYNQIAAQLVSGGDMQLAFVGVAGSAYALDSATSLAATNWIPQTTNLANSYGALLFTNSPNATTNNFWRIRSVP